MPTWLAARVGSAGHVLPTARLATNEEVDEHLDNVAAGILDLATSPLISAWARKPA